MIGNIYHPQLLLMGLRRSGKSSIQKVVFHKLAPNETLFLESTTRINNESIKSFVDFQIWDFPGQINFFESEFDVKTIFGGYGALIYIIDAQDEYYEALQKLHETIVKAHSINPSIHLEIFIHKVDGLSYEYKSDLLRDIQQRVQDDLMDSGLENIELSFSLTSIFDHSIHEAFSKVIQKLIPQLGALENLLNIFCSNSGVEKAFLFDIQSKIYIATDSSPVDAYSYEICSDYIDVILDVVSIYGSTDVNDSSSNPSQNNEDSSSAEFGTSSANMLLANGTAIYMRDLNGLLALVCILRSEAIQNVGLREYNVQCLQKAIYKALRLPQR